MWIWPNKRFEIKAALPAREAVSRVARRADDMLFTGEVEASGFVIRPVLMMQNAFAPRIQGRVREVPQGCVVEITMGLHKATTVFMILWFVLFGVLSVVRAVQGAWTSLAFSLFLLAFGYVWMALGFEKESRRDKRLLVEVIGGQ